MATYRRKHAKPEVTILPQGIEFDAKTALNSGAVLSRLYRVPDAFAGGGH